MNSHLHLSVYFCRIIESCKPRKTKTIFWCTLSSRTADDSESDVRNLAGENKVRNIENPNRKGMYIH